MALVVEDGTGKSDSNVYCSVADADAYHSARGNTNWASLSEPEKEQALLRGADYMAQVYGGRWKGERVTSTQAMDWPRTGVTANGYDVPSDIVPVPVVNANAELAFRGAAGPLLADQGRATKREKVDVIEVEYMDYGKTETTYGAVDGMLAPYLDGSASGTFRKVVRT